LPPRHARFLASGSRHKETFEGDLIAGAEAMGYKLGFAGWPPVREPWSSHSEFLTLHQLKLAAG